MRWLLLILLFSGPSGVSAEEGQSYVPDLKELDEQLSRQMQADFEALEGNTPEKEFEDLQRELDKRDSFNRLKKPKKSLRIKDVKDRRKRPWEPHPFRVQLKKGAPLYKSEGDNRPKYTLGQTIFARVQQMEHNSDKVWIFNSKDKKVFWTNIEHLIDVEDELTLTPQISARENFPKKERHHTTNEYLRTRHDFSYGLISNKATTLKQGISQNIDTLAGQSFDYTFYPLWDFPLSFGWILRYDSYESTLDSGGTVSWQAVSTGPKIIYEVYSWNKLSWEMAAEVTQSMGSSGTVDTNLDSTSFESEFLRFAIENRANWKTNWGTWSAGLRAGTENQTLTLPQGPSPGSKESQLSYALLFGYSFELDIGV